jgi:hypothetical protein
LLRGRRQSRDNRVRYRMSELWLVAIFAAYIVLLKWVLPRFGVAT